MLQIGGSKELLCGEVVDLGFKNRRQQLKVGGRFGR
jgi:hypothetical protein